MTKRIADSVNPARDALEKYINKPFEITQTHIAIARREDSMKCVLALALNTFFNGEFSNIMIHPNCITIGFDKAFQWCFYDFSKEVLKYITDFDSGSPVKPITLVFRYTGSSKYHPELCIIYPR